MIGQGLGEIIAKEGALKIKELTYNHCQCLNINNISNHVYNYFRKNPGTPVIFVVLEDQYKNDMLSGIKLLTEKVNLTPIVITDITEKSTRDFLDGLCSKRVIQVP